MRIAPRCSSRHKQLLVVFARRLVKLMAFAVFPFTFSRQVDYINKRNMVFNKKISRAFDKYTTEIRQNLERGTAL